MVRKNIKRRRAIIKYSGKIARGGGRTQRDDGWRYQPPQSHAHHLHPGFAGSGEATHARAFLPRDTAESSRHRGRMLSTFPLGLLLRRDLTAGTSGSSGRARAQPVQGSGLLAPCSPPQKELSPPTHRAASGRLGRHGRTRKSLAWQRDRHQPASCPLGFIHH